MDRPAVPVHRDEEVLDLKEDGVLDEDDVLVYRVEKVIGHRIRRLVRDDGRIHYEGCRKQDAQWVFRRDIDAPDLLHEYELEKSDQINGRRAKYPLQVLDFDYDGPGAEVSELREEVTEVAPHAPVVDDTGMDASAVSVDVITALMCKMRSIPTDSWRTDDLDTLSQVEPTQLT